MKADDLERQIKNLMMSFIESEKDALARDFSQQSFHELQDALSSADAIAFTLKMNQLYKEQGITDDYGDPLTIQHPENLSAKVTWNSDGTSGTIKFTEAEERWLRANKLYGDDILGKLGFNAGL
jgi:N-formylglutamate amidohydrolase